MEQAEVVYGGVKKAVVEVDDVGLASAVGLQGFHADGKAVEGGGCTFRGVGGVVAVLFSSQVVQYAPVAVSPAVDGLLHVAHDEAVGALRKAFEQEQAEVVPLHTAGVLKLVNHHVAYVGTQLLEDKRGVALAHQFVEQGVGVG